MVLPITLLCANACHADVLRYCDAPAPLTAAQQDKLLRWGALIKGELENSGQAVALVSRSGLDLKRFDQRYSHAGVSLKASANTAWSVRQLYYACDEQKPRLYDQGLAGFLLGTHDPAIGYVSVIFLPDTAAQALERAALNNRLGLSLLGTTYSANAYAFGLQYQNCNQWLIEMLASAWGEWGAAELTRKQAQAWLKGAGYEPISFDVSSRVLMWLGSLLPWLHDDDHPSEDLQQQIYRVSMPASIEAFVRATVPGAMRVEFCHAGSHAVVHRGWDALAEGCRPGEGDTLIALD